MGNVPVTRPISSKPHAKVQVLRWVGISGALFRVFAVSTRSR